MASNPGGKAAKTITLTVGMIFFFRKFSFMPDLIEQKLIAE